MTLTEEELKKWEKEAKEIYTIGYELDLKRNEDRIIILISILRANREALEELKCHKRLSIIQRLQTICEALDFDPTKGSEEQK